MRVLKTAAAVVACIATAHSIPSGDFKPVGLATGRAAVIAAKSRGPFTLSYNQANVATIDYGFEVAGWPYINVASLTRPVQIEFRYTEQFDALNQSQADGQYYFANGLTNTFRVETFNITHPGHYQSPLIQGGQRWQLATLLTPGSVTIQDIGFKASVDPEDTELDKAPSTFSCSNNLYNDIWKLGARASTAACVDAHSQLNTQNITSQGLYSPGQKPGITALAYQFVNYSMIFETKIVKGGTGWAFSEAPIGNGFLFIISTNVSNPEHAFVNQDTTIAPRNKLGVTFGRGPNTRDIIGDYEIPFEVQENTWYTIKTALSSSQYLSVTMEGHLLMNVSLPSLPPSLGVLTGGQFHNPLGGPFGFGPYQDQVAYFRNATAYAENGTQIYHSTLKEQSVLAEYGVATNNLSACLDGAKRDRLVWEGDFYHTARIIPASTGRWDLVAGTLQFFVNYQDPSPGPTQGFMDIAPPLGYPNAPQTDNLNPLFLQAGSLGGGFFGGLVDYQLLGFEAYYAYYQRTGNLKFVASVWPAYQKQIAALIKTIDPATGLANIRGFLGPSYGTAVCSLLVSALNGAAQIVTTFNDTDLAARYYSSAELVSNGINTHLWNETAGVYTLSNSSMGDWSTAGIALAITSGVANASRATSSLAQLSRLQVFPGYKDNTQLTINQTSNGVAAISPNTNGFLLAGAMVANETAPVKYMLDNLWGAAMVQNSHYSSGASWEYVGQDLTPGLGVFTSLSHPWGGAPTYILPEYIAGIRPISAGYKTWIIIPAYKGFGLDYAQATIKTGYGPLSVHWTLGKGGKLTVKVKAPKGTSGSIQLPGGNLIKANVNGKGMAAALQEVVLTEGESTVTLQV